MSDQGFNVSGRNPLNPFGRGRGGSSPSIEVAEGVIRFRPDMSEVMSSLIEIEATLDRIAEKAARVGVTLGRPQTPEAAPSGNERMVEVLEEIQATLDAIAARGSV